MKTIRYMERANLGNFSHREIEITEGVEDESIDATLNTLGRKVRWHLAKPEREADYAKHQLTIARGGDGATDEDKAKSLTFAKKFVAKFDEALKEIEG